jgi:hypothetical protein
MTQKKKRKRKAGAEKSRSRKAANAIHSRATRKMRPAAKGEARVKPTANAAPKPELQQKSAGVNRSEGIQLFKIAGRPSKDDFIAVYGPAGPRMTWQMRSAAGIPADRFQDALRSAMRSRK